MGEGLEIYNNNNVLQITSSYRNLQYFGKETLGDGYSFGVPSEYIVAFGCSDPSDRVCVFPQKSDSTCSYYWVKNKTGSTNIIIYIFGYAGSSSGSCFEVRNAKGEVVFSDISQYMRAVDSISGVLDFRPYTSNRTGEVIHRTEVNSSRKYAMVHGCMPYSILINSSLQVANVSTLYHNFGIGTITSTIDYTDLYSSVRSCPFGVEYGHYNYLLIDVTNCN